MEDKGIITPSIKRRICTKHGIYETAICELCKKQNAKIYNQQARNKESSKIYNTRRWQKLRAIQLIKNPLCVNFDACNNVATIADHIIEISDKGEAFSLDNLQSICQSCHNTKTAEAKRDRKKIQ